MPIELTSRGIANQVELFLALMPYMEWVRYQDIRDKFKSIITNHKDDGPTRWLAKYTCDKKYIEKKYDGEAWVHPVSGWRVSAPLLIRRIVKSIPRNHRSRLQLLGIDGYRAAQKRNKKKNPRPPSNTVKLTMDDIHYIKTNPHGISQRAAAEIYSIHVNTIKAIKAGHLPKHLKGQRFQSHSADTQVET